MYSYMSDDAIKAIIDAIAASSDLKYEIAFNRNDLARLVHALQVVWEHPDEIGATYGVDDDADLRDWAGDFVSSIANTFDIDMI